MSDEKLFELADRLKKARDRKKELDDELKLLNTEIEQLDSALSEKMADAELEKFSRCGTLFYLKNTLYVSPRAGRKEELYAALKAHGFGGLVTETVNSRTLDAFAREQTAENNDTLPVWLSELVNAYEKTTIGIRRG